MVRFMKLSDLSSNLWLHSLATHARHSPKNVAAAATFLDMQYLSTGTYLRYPVLPPGSLSTGTGTAFLTNAVFNFTVLPIGTTLQNITHLHYYLLTKLDSHFYHKQKLSTRT